MIDIAILDPHPVVRAGFRQLVSEHVDLRMAGEARSSAEAEALVKNTRELDVLVLELPAAGPTAVHAVAAIHAIAPNVRLLVFTTHPAAHYAIESLRQGACGYLEKSCGPRDLVDAIRTLALGRRYFSSAVGQLLANQMGRRQASPAHDQLSDREYQVFYKLARGETTGAIATGLALSVKTVSTYRTRLLEKLSLSTNSDLTYYAFNNRLIT
ncbi:LuxR C-terminal-related transcriptional regulator [Variovorax sp. PAMC 28711]|uniref:LuxR C-terminal-related transcriptional regulator n=1 Tax=Variovorax sp. PAMC 28711 TaxID=1795631 RepID=UPI00078CA593|nr:response regulator transcription factor [Variovorax sp. PAMC 28711]AMM23528.1 LuxR family transcriptional regulator [Variovorax sp. PAMC 28711]